MKNIFHSVKTWCMTLLMGGMACGLTSCNDFFEPETADALSGDDYMSSITEMATGYLGILTKMQAVGDKEIYLTDAGDYVHPGFLHCYSPEGVRKWSVRTGDIPAHFVFLGDNINEQ